MCLLSLDAFKCYLLVHACARIAQSLMPSTSLSNSWSSKDKHKLFFLFWNWFDIIYSGRDIDYLKSLRGVFSDLTGFWRVSELKWSQNRMGGSRSDWRLEAGKGLNPLEVTGCIRRVTVIHRDSPWSVSLLRLLFRGKGGGCWRRKEGLGTFPPVSHSGCSARVGWQ